MATRDELISQVLRRLNVPDIPFGSVETTALSTDSTIVVNGAALDAKPGVYEIESELIYVHTVSPEGGLLSNCIRGHLGTTAAGHTAGTVVRANPTFPRVTVLEAINSSILALYPKVFVVDTEDIATASGVTGYDIPATAMDVLSVDIYTDDDISEFRPSRFWRYMSQAPDPSVTGKAVQVRDFWSGASLRVTYTEPPAVFSSNTEFTTATGLPSYVEEVVVLGAGWRLLNWTLETPTVRTNQEGQPVAQGVDPAKLAQQLFATYMERLDSASLRLRNEVDAGSVHYIG